MAAGGNVRAKDKCGIQPLHHAALNSHAKAAAAALLAILAAGADVRAKDYDGNEPLHLAAANVNAAAAATAEQTLVAAGAAVRAKDRSGRQLLHLAAVNENAEAAAAVLQQLLAAGSDVRARDNEGSEPLHWAADNENAEAATMAVQVLMAAGADVRAQKGNGRTPSHYASSRGNHDAALALLAAGANLLVKDEDGETPLDTVFSGDLAHEDGMDMAAALVRAGPAGDVLEALCSSQLQGSAQRLFRTAIASHLPLSRRQWALIPAHHSPLSSALPAALAHSVDQASHLVCRLAPEDAQRLRTFALCIGRLQGLAGGQEHLHHHHQEPLWPLRLPATAVTRILSYFDA